MVGSTLFGILAKIPSAKNLPHCRGMTPSLVISLELLVRASMPMTENSFPSTILGVIALPSKTAEDTRLYLNLHHFLLFAFAHLFHLLDFVVGELLVFFHGALLVVFGDLFVLHRLLDGIVVVATDVANRGTVVFEHLVQMFDHVFA